MGIYCVVLRLYAEVYGNSSFFAKAVFLMYLYTLLALSFLFSSRRRVVLLNIKFVFYSYYTYTFYGFLWFIAFFGVKERLVFVLFIGLV